MSGLLEDIQAEDALTVPNRCVVHRILNELDAKDRADLEAALDDDGIAHVAISRALQRRGLLRQGGPKSVASHRKGQCGCARR